MKPNDKSFDKMYELIEKSGCLKDLAHLMVLSERMQRESHDALGHLANVRKRAQLWKKNEKQRPKLEKEMERHIKGFLDNYPAFLHDCRDSLKYYSALKNHGKNVEKTLRTVAK